MPKQPQDHRPKKDAVKRVSEEAHGATASIVGQEIVVNGRVGSVTVTVLDDPLEWEADVPEFLERWALRGGAITAEVIPFLTRIVSVEDGERIKMCRPTMRTAEEVAHALLGAEDEVEDSIETLGESQAS